MAFELRKISVLRNALNRVIRFRGGPASCRFFESETSDVCKSCVRSLNKLVKASPSSFINNSSQPRCKFNFRTLNRTANFDLNSNYKRHPFHTSACLTLSSQEGVSLKTKDASEYIDSADDKILDMLKEDFLVYEDFITPEEESSILEEIEPYLNRLKYEFNHWDDVSKFTGSYKKRFQE